MLHIFNLFRKITENLENNFPRKTYFRIKAGGSLLLKKSRIEVVKNQVFNDNYDVYHK